MANKSILNALKHVKTKHVVDAIDAYDRDPIESGDKFSALYKGLRLDPKQLLAQAYLFATASDADYSAWQDLTYSDFNEKLIDLGFRVVHNKKNAGDTDLPVMVYEVKKTDIVQANYQALFSHNRKHFYWNADKFAKLKPGDAVFVVNDKTKEVLFCLVESLKIGTTYDSENDLSKFKHQGQSYEVAGEWDDFVCLSVRENYTAPSGWKWKTLGSGEHTYLSGPLVSENSAANNIVRANLLLELTSSDSEGEIQLQVCHQALSSVLPHEIKSEESEIEPAIWYVMQGDTFSPELGQKYLWAPLADKRGNPQKHHLAVREVRRGDVVVHHDGGVVGISKAITSPSEVNNPFDEDRWDVKGTRVDVELICEVSPAITVDDIRGLRKRLAKALAEKRGPYNRNGTGNQGYLFEFTWEALAILLQQTKLKLPDNISRWIPPLDSDTDTTPIDQDLSTAPIPEKQTQRKPKEWLPLVQKYMAANGFEYSLSEVANFYLSLKTKPFVILAGISGTGKTQIVRQFAKAIGYGDERHCALIPVRPDWADNSDLVGYKNIQGQFEQKKLLKVLQDALAHPDEPFFVILDEMNLARVEHYFSDFLSVLETRERNDDGAIQTDSVVSDSTVNRGIPVSIPQNLLIVGTVNMDETTHPFSRKVLDRANAIEMNQISLPWGENESPNIPEITGIYADAFITPFINSIDLSNERKRALSSVISRLVKINDILEPAGLHFGYRVRDEFAFYLTIHKELDFETSSIMTAEQALDNQLMQKVLPRIQGSSLSVLTVLLKLLEELSGADIKTDMEYLTAKKTIDSNRENIKYPRSVDKLLFMLQRFSDDGFTSFWL